MVSVFPYGNTAASERVAINGAAVTEDQIRTWAAGAERRYDAQLLKERGRGRPGRGSQPSQVVPVRLPAKELQAIDAGAKKENNTRSEIMGEAPAAYAA